MKLTYQQIADLTGKHKNTVINRLNASTLTHEDQGPGKAKLWESVDSLAVIYEVEFSYSGCVNDDELDYNRERARAEKERADKLELNNAERRKELLPAQEVKREWINIITNAKIKLTGLPSKLSALTDDPEERRRLFIEAKAIIDEALIELGNDEV